MISLHYGPARGGAPCSPSAGIVRAPAAFARPCEMSSASQTRHGAVERLLGEPILRVEPIEPWSVERVHLSDRTVIVKWLRSHPTGVRANPAQVATERAAIEYLADLGLGIVPRLLAADEDAHLLILEDLHPAAPLSDDVTVEGLRAFARALGVLHASTAHVPDQRADDRDNGGGLARLWREVVDRSEIPLTTGAAADMKRILAAHADPGPFLVFSNGDAGVNNFLYHDGRGWLTDFEFAGFRSAFVDVSVLYVPGAMWMAVADPATDGTEAAYRTALALTVPEAEDDRRYGEGVAGAALAYAIARLHRLPLLDQRASGDKSRLQMVSTLETAAAVADSRHAYPALAAWSRIAASDLRRRWPDANVDLAALPAYARRQ